MKRSGRHTPRRATRRSKRGLKASIKRVVMSMEEKKYFDLDAFYQVGNSWNFTPLLAGIIQGTAATNRLGDKIFVHAIHITIRIDPGAPGVGTQGTVCRYGVAHNKQANNTGMTGLNGVFDANNVVANRFVPLMHRYSVLHDAVHTMVQTTGTAVGPPLVRQISIYPKKRIEFTSNAGTVSDLASDDYNFFSISDDPAGCCAMTVRSKVVFSDV